MASEDEWGSRDWMAKQIADGNSVLHKGQIHHSTDTLPTSTQMALGDEKKVAVTESELKKQMVQIESQLKDLEADRAKRAKADAADAAKAEADAKGSAPKP